MNPTLNAEMVDVLETLDVDDGCGVLVLTGRRRGVLGRHGPEGVLPRGRRRPRARADQGSPRRGSLAVAAPAHLLEADDRDGERLVLRRRRSRPSWPATSRSPPTRRSSASPRSTGIPPGVSSAGRSPRRSARGALFYVMTGRTFDGRRAARWASSMRAFRSRSCATRSRPSRASSSRRIRSSRAAEARLQALPGDELGAGRGLPLREAQAVQFLDKERPRARARAVPRRETINQGSRPYHRT